MIPGFKNVGERFAAKNYHPVSLLSLVSKAFFSDSQYGFRSSRSTTDLLTVLSDRVVRAFNRSGALGLLTGLGLLELWHLIYPRLLTGFGRLVYFTNLVFGNFRSDIWPYFFFSQ